MLNQIMNRLTSSGTAQGRRSGRATGRRAAMSRTGGAGTGGLRRGVRGRASRQAPETLLDRLLHRR